MPSLPFLLGIFLSRWQWQHQLSTLDALIAMTIQVGDRPLFQINRTHTRTLHPVPAPTATTQTSDGRRAGPRNANGGGLDSRGGGSSHLAPADAFQRRGRGA